jgi:hypothetical protein
MRVQCEQWNGKDGESILISPGGTLFENFRIDLRYPVLILLGGLNYAFIRGHSDTWSSCNRATFMHVFGWTMKQSHSQHQQVGSDV